MKAIQRTICKLLIVFLLLETFALSANAAETRLYSVADSYIQSNNPSINDGASLGMFAFDGQDGIVYSLLKFDISQLPANIEVTGAEFSLFGAARNDTQNTAIYRVINDWSETQVTWASFANAYDPAAIWTTSVTTTAMRYNYAVTYIVQDWYAKRKPNYGLVLRDINAGDPHSVAFSTRESGQIYDPVLTVSWENKVSASDVFFDFISGFYTPPIKKKKLRKIWGLVYYEVETITVDAQGNPVSSVTLELQQQPSIKGRSKAAAKEKWKTLVVAKTNAKGKFKAKFKAKEGSTFRLHLKGNSQYKELYSKRFKPKAKKQKKSKKKKKKRK